MVPKRAAVSLIFAATVTAFLAPTGRSVGEAQRPRPLTTLPLEVHVAHIDGEPVVARSWTERQLRHANDLFRPSGIRFEVAGRHRLDGRHARLETRRDRHALGAYLRPGHVDWFVVASLRDVDEPDRMRQGVHWRPRGEDYAERAHLVVTSSIAGRYVLAHELGHYFGNGHSPVAGNIMSYEQGDGPPRFDAEQNARIRFSVRRWLRRGELEAIH